MKKDDLVFVGHRLDAAQSIAAKLEHVDREAFDQDENLRLAIVHLIQTVGEAARRVSDEFRETSPVIPWRTIVGMRHKVVHDYLYVNYDIVWDVATVDLPALIPQLQAILGE
ncbi:MAG: DUF86 domain-containing protein [Bythopirellula sp.]|nr:DUF86 domain-containing protein [Bythopirellula sp.]